MVSQEMKQLWRNAVATSAQGLSGRRRFVNFSEQPVCLVETALKIAGFSVFGRVKLAFRRFVWHARALRRIVGTIAA